MTDESTEAVLHSDESADTDMRRGDNTTMEYETWEEEAEEGALMIANAMGVQIEDVAAVVEEIPDGLPQEAPVSRLSDMAEKSGLDVAVEREEPTSNDR